MEKDFCANTVVMIVKQLFLMCKYVQVQISCYFSHQIIAFHLFSNACEMQALLKTESIQGIQTKIKV